MFSPRRPWVCHGIFLFLCFPTLVYGQLQASVTGCVEDSSQAAIPGATVVLTTSERATRYQTQTDEKGCFRLDNVRDARYQLQVLAEEFSPYQREVLVQNELKLDTIVLQIAPTHATVLVTAARMPASSDTLGSTVDVIDAHQIEESQIRTVSDLLRNVGSMNVTRTGNAGGITTLFFRGGPSNYTKVLIDGIPVNQPGGTYDFAHIPTDNISRVEIVRGPQSALFGSDAISGVVQMVTQHGSTPEADYSVEGGNYGTFLQRASLRGSWKKLDFSNTFSRIDTDNIGRNNDYRNASYFGNFGFIPDSNQTLRATLFHISTNAGTPGPNAPGFFSYGPNDRAAHVERALGLTYGALTNSRLTQHLAYRFYDYDYTYWSAYGPSFIFSTRHRAEYHGDAALAVGGTLSYGVDFDRENATVADKRRTRDNTGYYVQDQLRLLRRLDITVGVRLERNTTFGTNMDPRIAASLRLLPGMRLRFAAATGIKEPNFIENFSESRFYLGNPDLQAERSRTWETGIQQSFWRDRITADITWFDNRFRNLIELVGQEDGSSRYQNIGRVFARGLELRARARVHRLHAQANYTYLDGSVLQSTQNDFPFRPGDPLLRRPRHSGDFSLTWIQPKWTAYWSTRYVGTRADSDFFTYTAPLKSNPGYAVSDASFSYSFPRYLSAFVRIENVFNRNYQEALGYLALGRSFTVGTRIRIGDEK